MLSKWLTVPRSSRNQIYHLPPRWQYPLINYLCLDKKERTLPREFFNFSGQNRKIAESSMDTTERRSSVRSCLRNCDICESFYDKFFRSYLCNRSCIDFDGRIEVNCLNILSIAPFLDSLTLEQLTGGNV